MKMVALRRMMSRSRRRAAARMATGAMGVPVSAYSSTWLLPETDAVRGWLGMVVSATEAPRLRTSSCELPRARVLSVMRVLSTTRVLSVMRDSSTTRVASLPSWEAWSSMATEPVSPSFDESFSAEALRMDL